MTKMSQNPDSVLWSEKDQRIQCQEAPRALHQLTPGMAHQFWAAFLSATSNSQAAGFALLHGPLQSPNSYSTCKCSRKHWCWTRSVLHSCLAVLKAGLQMLLKQSGSQKTKGKKKIKKQKSRHWEIKHTQIWQVFHCDYTWFKFLTASSFRMKAQGVPPHPIFLSWANSFLTSLSFLIDHKAEGTIGLNIQFGQNIRTFPQRVSRGLTKRGRRFRCFDVESVAGLCFDWSL